MTIGNITNASFLNHTPGPEDIERMQATRTGALRMFELLQQIIPDCAEKVLAIRELENCLMWANKAIVLHPANGIRQTDFAPLWAAFGPPPEQATQEAPPVTPTPASPAKVETPRPNFIPAPISPIPLEAITPGEFVPGAAATDSAASAQESGESANVNADAEAAPVEEPQHENPEPTV
jgi:hypothetical protein